MAHKAQNEKAVILHLSFFICLSVEHVIVAFVVERGNTGVVLGIGGSVGKKLVGRGRNYFLASL